MLAQPDLSDMPHVNDLARAASTLGYEIVDLAAFVDMIEGQARDQRAALNVLVDNASEIQQANTAVDAAATDLVQSVERTYDDVQQSAGLVRTLGSLSRDVANWVQDLSDRTSAVRQTLTAVENNNSQIASISMQVNTLAINAKIEAARAGDAGRGFAVVAEAINELSKQTKSAAAEISTNIDTLTTWIATLGAESADIAQQAMGVIDQSTQTDQALSRMETSVDATRQDAGHIAQQSVEVQRAVTAFGPNMQGIEESIATTTDGILEAHKRIERLVDASEEIVQGTAALGGMTDDAPFIEEVQRRARHISTAFEEAVAQNVISEATLFDRTYVPVPGTCPQQFTTGYSEVLDRILPPIQEPVLRFDSRVIMCAAIDINGYLPTHNKIFSYPQSDDEIWNTAHCRHRRMFDDRVGLKAGRTTAPFLLQVYRRDMGGGSFKIMKDLAAPIFVNGRHWGGLRLAYTL